MLHDDDNRLYDIQGHRVLTISGQVHIDIDGVAFDRFEADKFMKGSKKVLEADKAYKADNKFHVKIPRL